MIVPASVLAEIREGLERAYPDEGCGLLLGVPHGTRRVVRQVPVANRRVPEGVGRRRYLIAPDDFRAVVRAAAVGGLEVIGVYHAHPDAPAEPSAYDLEQAWPWYDYLIVSLRDGRVTEMRAWQLRDDRSGFVEGAVCVPRKNEGRQRR